MITVTFQETNTPIRYEIWSGEPWFHAGDVCKVLGLQNPSEVVSSLDAENRQKLDRDYQVGLAPWFIDEEALYTIALGCRDARKPGTVAYNFRKWVIQVIKDIRKTGTYKATEQDQQHFSPFGLTVQIATVEEAQGKNQLALQNAEPGTGQVLTLVKESAALRQEKIALDRLLKATPTKEAVDRDQAIENHILERLGRFPDGVTIQHLIVSKFLANRKMRSKKAVLPVLQKLRSQGRCEEIALNTWKLTGDPS